MFYADQKQNYEEICYIFEKCFFFVLSNFNIIKDHKTEFKLLQLCFCDVKLFKFSFMRNVAPTRFVIFS